MITAITQRNLFTFINIIITASADSCFLLHVVQFAFSFATATTKNLPQKRLH